MKAFDKQQLVTAMAQAYELYQRLPYWDNTAKLHGKMAMLEPTAEEWEEGEDLGRLLRDLKALEGAVGRLHDRDPHTQLLRHLTEWREKLEAATPVRASDSNAASR